MNAIIKIAERNLFTILFQHPFKRLIVLTLFAFLCDNNNVNGLEFYTEITAISIEFRFWGATEPQSRLKNHYKFM